MHGLHRHLAALILGGLAAGTAAPSAATTRDIAIGVDIYAGGLRIMTIDTTARLAPQAYRVETTLRTQGMADWFTSFRQRSLSEGEIAGGSLRPRLHSQQGVWRGDPRQLEIRYDGLRPTSVKLDPPDDPADRDPVPEALWGGTVDPISAVLFVNQGANAAAPPCTWRVPVFDGRRRYDLAFTPVAEETLAKGDYGVYAGPAVKCQVHYDAIAGQYKGSRWRLASPEPAPAYLWVARPERSEMWIPVRFETENLLGWVFAHLTRLELPR